MVELARGPQGWRLGHGGDTLNTAIHLARQGLHVAYFSALGADPFSDELRGAWQREGLATSLVLTDPDRRPGLYAIRTDAAGERSFTYWRSDSAARGMMGLPGSAAALAEVEACDLLVFSLITLAILPPAGRERLLEACRRVRSRGDRVAFDGNYRPALWASSAEARAARDAALAVCDIGLPTLADETALSGAATPQAVAAQWTSRGVGEVVVKLGAEGCLAPDGTIVPPADPVSVVDTSGAGDAFNGGYLAARLAGLDIHEAALAGHRLAGWVVGRPGAIPARDGAAPYAG